MRPIDLHRSHELETLLYRYEKDYRPLPGISDPCRRAIFLEQLLESVRRVRYVSVITKRKLSDQRANPMQSLFDPLKAAILHQRRGNLEEAFWLVFLFVHFGRHSRAGWRYAREVYGRLGDGLLWDWKNISTNPTAFREWLAYHQGQLKRKGVSRGFGNHRKYQSLDANSPNGTGAAFESYVHWVNPPRTHKELFTSIYAEAERDRRRAFHMAFLSLDAVASFGRTARFDYLAMAGNLDLAPIEPGAAYLQQATGPLRGARLLFGGASNTPLRPKTLEFWLKELDDRLCVGMQVLEDALCNWQKSPDRFKPFRG